MSIRTISVVYFNINELNLPEASDKSVSHAAAADTGGFYTYIPNGALSIASVLKKAGHKVSFRDLQLVHLDSLLSMEKISIFLDTSADILCIGCMVNMLPYLIVALKYFKKKYPNKILILGGPGPTDVYDVLLEDFLFIDFIVRGEGETTILELVDSLGDYDRLKKVKGISYNYNGKVWHNPDRELIENLDTLPPLDFSLLEGKYNYGYFFTSRGCPFNCGYCNNVSFWRRKVRQRGLGNVFAEIKEMEQRHGLTALCAGDDTFFASDKTRLGEFRKFYRDNQCTFLWNAHHRVNVFNETIMEEMQKVNLTSVLLGIDSGSNKILKILDRNYTIEQAYDVVTRISKYLKSVRVTFIYGYPFETIDDFLNTLEAILHLSMLKIQIDLTLLAPLKHTDIYKNYHGSFNLTEGPAEAAYSLLSKIGEKEVSVSRIIRTYKSVFSLPADKYVFIPPEVKALIRDYPRVFFSYYNYDAQIVFKDMILKEFLLFLEKRFEDEKIVNIKDNLIYFGKGHVRLLKSGSFG